VAGDGDGIIYIYSLVHPYGLITMINGHTEEITSLYAIMKGIYRYNDDVYYDDEYDDDEDYCDGDDDDDDDDNDNDDDDDDDDNDDDDDSCLVLV
jgi:hypothetical protein